MSFLSAEPHSRVVLDSHSDFLLAQFDTHLGIVASRYLAFFQERRSIEITYTNSLRKLHSKAETLDTSVDPRAEPTTTRAAWDTIRDNIKSEVNTQQAFLDILDNGVIKPLTRLKKSNDETRSRIEKDLNGSAARYANFAEGKIAELQRAYLKKYHPQQDTQSAEVFPNRRLGGNVSLFRRRRENATPAPAISEEVFDNDCRGAVTLLNHYRSRRIEYLRDGYDCLEELVFTTTIKDVLAKYMDGMVVACAKYDSLAQSTRAEAEKALAGTDKIDLKANFRRDLSFSIPPLTLFRNYRSGAHSNLVFGVPLVDLATNEDNVPKVMRMCIEEVEMRGLSTHNIYYSPDGLPAEVRQLRHRFENDMSFSFKYTANIKFVAMFLENFLYRLPESLLMLSLQDYRQYRQDRIRFTLLRSKIRELHPVHRASLGALSLHLLRVASHSDRNAMTVRALAAQFSYPVLRGNEVLQDGVYVKKLVMEDLIQNARTLFDEHPSPSEPFHSPNMAETTSTFTQELGILTSTRSSLSSLPMEARFTPQTNFLSPLQGFPSSNTPTGVETSTQEQVIPEGGGPNAVKTLPNSTPAEALFAPPTSVDEWRLRVPRPRLSTPPDAQTIPQSPPESVLYSTTDFPHSSVTSLQTGMGLRFS